MGNETISRDGLSTNYVNKIKHANAEIRALSRYFELIEDTELTMLEKYLQDLYKHPASDDPTHNDYNTINNKIETVSFNLNLIPKPDYYPSHQKSYTDRYTSAKSILKEYAKRTKELDAFESIIPIENARESEAHFVVSSQDFVSSTPKIISSNQTTPIGGKILFTLDADYQNISHFWLFGNYNSEDRQLSRTNSLVVNTTGLEAGKQYRVRATLTSKQREQKHLQTFFNVTETRTQELEQPQVEHSTNQTPQILPGNIVVPLGEKITFSVDTAGLDVVHQYWLSGSIRKGGVDRIEVDTTNLDLGKHEVKVSLTLRDRAQSPILIRAPFTVEAVPITINFNDANIELEELQYSMRMNASFEGQGRAFYSWVIDSFTSTFRETSKGLNVNSLELFDLQTGQYRARLSISHQGITRNLEKRFAIEGDNRGEGQIAPSQSTDDFIQEAATVFSRTGNTNQDKAHDAILHHLLSGTYSEQYLSSKDPKKPAYYAVRNRGGHDHTSNPLHLVRSRADLNKVSDTNFFIRDFMQLQTRGGSKESPYVVGDTASTGEQRNGLVIVDGILETSFVNDFNKYVESINETNIVQQRPGRVKFFNKVAHRDAIQLIPYDKNISQFAGVTMRHVTINGNVIASDATLQGIFATDGTFQHLNITNNSIQTEGAHTISISGMLSGKIKGNTDLHGQPLAANKITLSPLRIGGGANIYVMSFQNAEGIVSGDPEYFAYEKIKGNQAINDRRNKKDRIDASYWKNVNLPALQLLFTDTFAQVKQLNTNKSETLAQLREANRPYIDIRTVADDYQSAIDAAWDTMMSQVAERDDED